MLIGMLYDSLHNLTGNEFGFIVQVDHAINLWRIGLRATDRTLFINFINQHINGTTDFRLKTRR